MGNRLIDSLVNIQTLFNLREKENLASWISCKVELNPSDVFINTNYRFGYFTMIFTQISAILHSDHSIRPSRYGVSLPYLPGCKMEDVSLFGKSSAVSLLLAALFSNQIDGNKTVLLSKVRILFHSLLVLFRSVQVVYCSIIKSGHQRNSQYFFLVSQILR